MPLEAMLSGALVIAYKNGPYSEYLNSRNSILANNTEMLEIIGQIEGIAEKFESRDNSLAVMSKKAYDTARRYSLQREAKSVIEFWEGIFHSD
jgi:hypothetical protein